LRKISREVENKIFRLWLGGYTYREISLKCGGVSLATISKVIELARKRAPDIDELRDLNVALKKGDRSVYDAVRGGILLDKVNQLGVGLEDLEDYVKTAERISSGKEVEAERFVESAVGLIRLEAETGKAYGDVIKDFEEKLSETKKLEAKMVRLEAEYKEKRSTREGEIEKLNREKALIKSLLEAQGLGWDEGIQILKDTKDLREEKASVKDEIAKHAINLSNWEKDAKNLRLTINRLKAQLLDLRQCIEREKVGFDLLLKDILSAQDRLYAIQAERRNLFETVKAYKDIIVVHEQKERIASLQAEIRNLTAETQRLSAAEYFLTEKVNGLKGKIDGLEAERSKKEKQFQEAKETAADARGASERILAGLKKERGVLEAEIEHVRAALKDDVQKLRKKPREISMRLSPEQFKTLEKIASNGDVEALIREQITEICEYAS